MVGQRGTGWTLRVVKSRKQEGGERNQHDLGGERDTDGWMDIGHAGDKGN